MSSLNGGSQRRTLYVGHDTDLDCLASFFGLSWATDPYPADAATPGSGLLLEKSLSGYIRATVLYSTFETVSDLVLRRAPANFSMTGTNEVSGEQFTNLVESKLVQECIKM